MCFVAADIPLPIQREQSNDPDALRTTTTTPNPPLHHLSSFLIWLPLNYPALQRVLEASNTHTACQRLNWEEVQAADGPLTLPKEGYRQSDSVDHTHTFIPEELSSCHFLLLLLFLKSHLHDSFVSDQRSWSCFSFFLISFFLAEKQFKRVWFKLLKVELLAKCYLSVSW